MPQHLVITEKEIDEHANKHAEGFTARFADSLKDLLVMKTPLAHYAKYEMRFAHAEQVLQAEIARAAKEFTKRITR